METLDHLSQEAQGDSETTPEPLSISTESLEELLNYIHDLWQQHAHAIQDRADDVRGKIEEELKEAYQVLETCRRPLGHPDAATYIQQPLLENALYELWFSCHHLDKVIKSSYQ